MRQGLAHDGREVVRRDSPLSGEPVEIDLFLTRAREQHDLVADLGLGAVAQVDAQKIRMRRRDQRHTLAMD